MAWEKEWKAPPVWPVAPIEGWPKNDPENTPLEEVSGISPEMLGVKDNLKPTHDPHTNPNAFLYYECQCGERLDPHTKSFAGLNNTASLAGWKIRWGSDSYVPYCPKCGEEVE